MLKRDGVRAERVKVPVNVRFLAFVVLLKFRLKGCRVIAANSSRNRAISSSEIPCSSRNRARLGPIESTDMSQ